MGSNFGIVIHGGAGAALDANHTAHRPSVLAQALAAGHAVLAKGGPALDAVIAAVQILEDAPLFNAGRGSVLAADGVVEMDAAVMTGEHLQSGGVAAVRGIRNPVVAAKLVMEHAPHTILCGSGAENFAKQHNLAFEPPDYFRISERVAALEKLQGKNFDAAEGLGTVGAVALDSLGHLAAATSTGGLTGKLPGRVGDSCIVGAGLWADDRVGALSCTGTGDVFIRLAAARDAACLADYKNLELDTAVGRSLNNVIAAGGSGGMIGITPTGKAIMRWTTPAMSRGHQLNDSAPFIAV